MRRRRRFKGTWLPNIGIVNAIPTRAPTAGREMVVTIGAGSNEVVGGVVPIIMDEPQEPDTFTPDIPLAYFTANEYSIRRIVGKCWIQARADWKATSTANLNSSSPCALVTSGLFVARAGTEDISATNPDVPIGWVAEGAFSYNPDIPNAIREPWIWRRQWVIGNPSITNQLWQNMTVDPGITRPMLAWDLPANNFIGRAVADGPHIDAKTRRRVGNDDRLWWCVFAQNFPRDTDATNDYTVDLNLDCHLDVRVFGALRKARNRGNF